MNIEMINQSNPPCKSCGSTHVRKYGLYKGVQNYFCNECGTKFNLKDTTFHMKTDANEVSSALNTYYEGMSVRATTQAFAGYTTNITYITENTEIKQ